MSACWVCGGETTACALLAPLPFRECGACGFVFRDDRDSTDVHATYAEGAYADADVRGTHYASPEQFAARRRDARVRLGFMAPYARSGRLLDVGAAGGAFVAEAGAAGFTARGIEATPEFAKVARESFGVDVRTGTIESARLEAEAYDVVTLWHVLEHIPDPVPELRRLRDALKVGGVLALEVPNFGNADARAQGVSWPSLEPDVHVNQFAPPSLRRALESAGLEVVVLDTVPITPYLTPRAALGPGHIAHRLRAAITLRTPATHHPSGHELLRAVARRPA